MYSKEINKPRNIVHQFGFIYKEVIITVDFGLTLNTASYKIKKNMSISETRSVFIPVLIKYEAS